MVLLKCNKHINKHKRKNDITINTYHRLNYIIIIIFIIQTPIKISGYPYNI